jgi:hypothetical protein
MSPLNIHPEEVAPVSKKKNGNKTLKVFLGIGVLIAIPVIGSTFAATININSGGTVQFAQGSSSTAACDEELTTSATSAYLSGSFKLKTVTISGIDLTSGCEGKTLIVSVDNANSEADISTGVKQVSVTIPGTVSSSATELTNITAGFTTSFTNASGASYQSGGSAVAYDEAGKIVITITTPALASSSVTKILVQSS